MREETDVAHGLERFFPTEDAKPFGSFFVSTDGINNFFQIYPSTQAQQNYTYMRLDLGGSRSYSTADLKKEIRVGRQTNNQINKQTKGIIDTRAFPDTEWVGYILGPFFFFFFGYAFGWHLELLSLL